MTKKGEKKVLKKNPERNGLIGMILGVISIVFFGNNGIIIGIIGLGFAIRQQQTSPTREGKIGIILNIIGIVLAIIFIIFSIYYLAPLLEQFGTEGINLA